VHQQLERQRAADHRLAPRAVVPAAGSTAAPEARGVAEALTNVVKHAQATRATVRAAADEGVLALEVRDDGIGGAQPDRHGPMGIADRIETLGGRLSNPKH
jgi:signal transduction histidine kinase